MNVQEFESLVDTAVHSIFGGGFMDTEVFFVEGSFSADVHLKNGEETLDILSVGVGSDGLLSFRQEGLC